MTPSRSALAVVALMFAASAWAQQSPMPEDIAWKLLELGRVIDPPKTAELYAPLQEKEPYQGVTVERDVKYGPADRNLLDIFAPDTAASARPVLIFVHGGAFVGGDKRTTPTSPFYDNIMLWAVKNGFVGVNVTIASRHWRLGRRAPRISPPRSSGSPTRSASAAAMPRASIWWGTPQVLFTSQAMSRIPNFTR